jgi:hypothetical protein
MNDQLVQLPVGHGVEEVDLPTPYSGHNSYWWWATPPAGTATVLAPRTAPPLTEMWRDLRHYG